MIRLSCQALVPNKITEIAKIGKISSNLSPTLKPSPNLPNLSSMHVFSDPEGMPNPNQSIAITPRITTKRTTEEPPQGVTAINLCRVAEKAYGSKANQICEVFYQDTRLKLFGDYETYTPGKQDPEPFRQRIEASWVAVLREYDDTFTADRIAWSGRSRWVPKQGGRQWKTSFHLVVQGFVTTLCQLNAFIQHHKQDLLAGEGLDEGVYNKSEQLFNMVGACKGLNGDMHTLAALPEGGAYHEHIVQHLTGEELELAAQWTPPAALGEQPCTKKRRSAQRPPLPVAACGSTWPSCRMRSLAVVPIVTAHRYWSDTAGRLLMPLGRCHQQAMVGAPKSPGMPCFQRHLHPLSAHGPWRLRLRTTLAATGWLLTVMRTRESLPAQRP